MGSEKDKSRPEVMLGTRVVGDGRHPYVIAELSANHGGDLETALGLVDLAAEAGADAVKLQTYTPESMTLDIDRPPFVVGPGTLWEGRTLFDLYREAQTPWDWHAALFERARSLGIDCLSTPFDRAAVDFLEQFDPPAHKIASFELLDLDLIEHAASTGRPLIISTGMASVDEIDDAVQAARSGGEGGVVLLRCNSAYPADPGEMGLATIPEMATRWGLPVGFSDHSPGELAATVAVGLGACVVEKHFIDDRGRGGPDAAFSAEPAEFAALRRAIDGAWRVRGSVRFGPSAAEQASMRFRRSLFVVRPMAEGEVFSAENVRAIRPAGGLPPKELTSVIGRQASAAIEAGTPLCSDHLA